MFQEGEFQLAGRLAPGESLTIRRSVEGRCGIEHGRAHPGLARCPGVIDTTGTTVRDEAFPPSEPPSRLGGGPALRLLPPVEPDSEPHAVPLLEATG